jgi:hypothetical protein
MTIEERVLEKLRVLPSDKKEQVLRFVDTLMAENGAPGKLHSLEGLLEDLNVDISDEEIAAARREMWGNFPRDID